jgi:hypothetical protein
MQVHANEGGVTQTRGGIYWIILPAGCKSLVPSHILLSYMICQKNANKKDTVSYFLLLSESASYFCILSDIFMHGI